MVVRSNEFDPEWIKRRFPDMMLAIERDLGLQAGLGARHAYDGHARFPMAVVKNLGVYQEHWRVFNAGQQFVAPVWQGGAPVGYFTMSRGVEAARVGSARPEGRCGRHAAFQWHGAAG